MNKAYSLLTVKSFSQSGDVVTIEGIASSPTTDRVGDIVESMGAVFKTPMPLMLHHDSTLPVGNVVFAKPTAKGIPFKAELPIVAEPGKVQDRINEAIHSLKYKLIAAVSIGFNAIDGAVERMKSGGLRFKEWEWLELSLVTIPVNPDAVITGVKSIDTALRAATGRTRERVDREPCASGTNQQPALSGFSFARSQKGYPMKTIQEQMSELNESRTIKTARMEEIYAEGRKPSEDEKQEFDVLKDEVSSIDDDVRRKSLDLINIAKARPVSESEGARRGTSPNIIVRGNTDQEEKFKGQNYTRMVIAKALSRLDDEHRSPASIAEMRWGKSNPTLVRILKANEVPGGGTGSGEWGSQLVTVNGQYTGDFIEYLYANTIFDKLGLREIPANVMIKGQDGAATGYWVGESKPIPATSGTFTNVTLLPLKVAALAVVSNELLRDSSPAAEQLVRDALVNACSQRIDATFLSASAAVAGVSPAGIRNGLTAIVSSGTDAAAIRTDVAAGYAPFIAAENADGLVLVTTPALAKSMSLMVNALGQTEFAGLTASGGVLLGDRVITSSHVPTGLVLLIKPSDIFKIGDLGVQVSISRDAMIEQSTVPTGATDTPVAASAAFTSMFQEESTAIKVVRPINFAKRRASAVAVISGAAYA